MSKADNTKIDCSPKRIAWLAKQLSSKLNESIGEIHSINEQTKILSINAKITAARAGEAGKSFSVVANEIMSLSHRTSTVANTLNNESRGSIEELSSISSMLDTQVKGDRLSTYARTNIDLIDRNLYERSCDVRWWATDNSLVEALTQCNPQTIQHASKRLGVILSAYTVYFDLILADTTGKIIANGRPDLYQSQGSRADAQEWFQAAMRSQSGDEYGFQSVHKSSLVNNERVLIYSCAVRQNGSSNGEIIGVLGIAFNWDSLAQIVVKNTPLSESEWAKTRACIIDHEGMILADSDDKQLTESLSFPHNHVIFSNQRNFLETPLEGNSVFVAHAPSEGFETYKTGWFSVLIQSLE